MNTDYLSGSGYRTEYGNCGVAIGRSVGTAEWLQDGVWKLRSGYRTECGKCGVATGRSMETAEWL